MNKKHVSALFNELGMNPSYKGYPYLIHIVCLTADYNEKSLPFLKELHQYTAEYFGVSEGKVRDDIRTLLRNYWNHKNAVRFSAITKHPIDDPLTPKEFIAIITDHLSRNP